MQQPEEAAAKAEAQRRAALHLEAERGIVEPQLGDAFAQFLEVRRVNGKQPAEYHRLDFLEPRQRRHRTLLDRGDGVTHACLRHFLDLRSDEPDLAGPQFGQLLDLGAETADPVDQVLGPTGHELDRQTLPDHPVDYADKDHDAKVGIVPAVDQHRLQGRRGIAGGRRDAGNNRFEHFLDADPALGAGQHRVARVEADDFLDLRLDPLRLGCGKVDLVDDRHDLVVVLDRLVDVGQRLRLDALRCIDHQQRAFAGGE